MLIGAVIKALVSAMTGSSKSKRKKRKPPNPTTRIAQQTPTPGIAAAMGKKNGLSACKRTICISDLDGFEFEKLVHDIFSKLGYGEIERTVSVGDRGRDLIINSTEGTIYVECKHHPRSTIGRPVIQKLHSIVYSEGAKKGIVVTSGRFSQKAISHAATLDPPIELIDGDVLRDLALRAGIELTEATGQATIYTFPLVSDERFAKNLARFLEKFLISRPEAIEEAISVRTRDVTLRPVYSVEYRLDAVFETSVGVVHTEEGSGRLLVDGSSGEVLDQRFAKYFQNGPLEKASDIGLDNVRVKGFRLLGSEVRRAAISFIIRTHTREISYVGRNNQIYVKLCIPRGKDVYVSDVSQIYIPETRVKFATKKRLRTLDLADNGTSDFYVYGGDIYTCDICAAPLRGKSILCNCCGNIAHKPSFFRSHGFMCKNCGKTICRDCAYYLWRWRLIRTVVCPDCAKTLQEEGKNPKPVRPIGRFSVF